MSTRTEFQFLAEIRSRFDLRLSGDDCAVFPKDGANDQLISADMLVEDVDFRLERTPPEFLGEKALNVSLSDIAAMGGRPKYSMLSLAIPTKVWESDFLDKFYSGYMQIARNCGVELIGGDISKTDGKFVIDSIVIGEVRAGKAIFRTGSNAGDAIYVTNELGKAAGGLHLLEKGLRYSENLPEHQKALIKSQLSGTHQPFNTTFDEISPFITSMIDVSDGLLADLGHICKASKVGAELEREKIPVADALSVLDDLTDEQKFEMAVTGGEDFCLLFTFDEKNFSGEIPVGFHRIGKLTESIETITLTGDRNFAQIYTKGYTHF